MLISAGAAAGLAASFGAPLAAVFFIMEVALKDFASSLFPSIVIASVSGAVTSRVLMGDVDFVQNVNGNLNVQVGNQGGGPAHRRVRMGFPAIRRSLMMLKRTRNILQHGRSVFGGHRAQAIQAVDQAIAQCKAALEYARNHKK